MAPRKKYLKGKILVEVKPDGAREVTAYLSGELFKERNLWVSYCKALDLSTCGKTKQEVLDNTREAIVLWFQSCLNRGTLDDALQELKWSPSSRNWASSLTAYPP